MNIQLCSFGCYLNSYKRISKLSNKELLTWTYKLVICTELFHESSLPKQNLNCSHTCGRIRSSTLNATCDPNIDLQFATASSLVKLGNRNLLCSEAMLSLKEIKMAGSLLVQTEPLLLSNILIGSSVLTLETGHWERGFLRDDIRAFREEVCACLAYHPCAARERSRVSCVKTNVFFILWRGWLKWCH